MLSGVEEARKEIDASGQIKDVDIACPIIVFTMQQKCQSFASQYFSAHYYYSKKHNLSHTVNKLGYVQIKCSKLDHLCSVTLKLPPLIVAYSDEKCSLVVLVFPPNTCVLLSSSSSSIPSPSFHRPPISKPSNSNRRPFLSRSSSGYTNALA